MADFAEHPELLDVPFSLANRLESQDKYEQAESIYQRIALSYPDKPRTQIEELKRQIVSLIRDGNDIEAEAAIEKLIADFNDHPGLAGFVLRSGHGYRRRANELRREGLTAEATVNNLKAAALYDRVIGEFGSSAFAASAYFFSGLCYRDIGLWQDCLDCCERLLEGWPEYKYASWAKRLAQDCSEKLAAQSQ